MVIKHKGYEFAVVFENGGQKITVYDSKGQVVHNVLPLSTSPLNGINQLDTLQVAHKPNKSPCCVIWDGKKYCWC